MRNAYNKESWIDPRIEVRDSAVDRKGLFAKQLVKEGEVLTIWGGRFFTRAEIDAKKHMRGSAAQIDDDIFLGALPDDPVTPDNFLNHSCDPNLWLKDEITLVARRDIQKDEELTADYGSWMSLPTWKMECKCGSKLCRKEITGNDWKLKELQERYKGHLSPYLEEKIKKSA